VTGIYTMTDAEYFADPALNHSSLRWLVESTPAHFRYRVDNPHHEPTSDMEFGSAVHSLVLGGPEVVRVDADSWRSNAAKERRDEVRTAGGFALLADDYRRAEACRDAVHAHPLAAKLLATTQHREVVIKWDDDGITLKAKVDGISGRVVWDLKTTYNADTGSFGRSAAKFGYATQQAWYEDAARSIGITEPKFLFVVVEKEPPHLVNVIALDQYDVELGRQMNRRALDTYRRCVEADDWPGYPDGINTAQLPRLAEIAMETA
jgi:hypothetical protein